MVPTLATVAAFEQSIVDMFRHEWRLSGLAKNTRPLTSIAIVDAAPEEQYLYPEFLLFQQLFERHACAPSSPTRPRSSGATACCGTLTWPSTWSTTG